MAPGGNGGFRQAKIGAATVLGSTRRLAVVLVSPGGRRAVEALEEAWGLAVGLDSLGGDGVVARSGPSFRLAACDAHQADLVQ